MAITFVSFSGGGGTGAVDPGLPASIQTDDLLILTIEGHGDGGGADAAPTGGEWTAIDGSTGSVESDTTAGSATKNTTYYHVYDSTAEPSTNVPDAGQHTLVVITAWRGVDTTTPIDGTASSSDATQDNDVTITGLTTGEDACMVVAISTAGDGDTSAYPGSGHFSSWANADLASITEAVDVGTNAGNDGQIGIAYGIMTTAGAVGDTTASFSKSEKEANWCVSLAPAGAGGLDITPAAVTVTATAGTLTITTGAVDITPDATTVTVTAGTLTVAAAAVDITPDATTVTATAGELTITTGVVDITPAAVTVTATPGTLTITSTVDVTPDAVTVTATPGTLTVAAGAVDITPDPVTVTVTPGTLTVALAAGGLDITPAAVTVTATAGELTITTGVVDITPDAVTATVTPGTVALSIDTPLTGPTVTATPGTLTVALALAITGPTVTITPGTLTISGTGDPRNATTFAAVTEPRRFAAAHQPRAFDTATPPRRFATADPVGA